MSVGFCAEAVQNAGRTQVASGCRPGADGVS